LAAGEVMEAVTASDDEAIAEAVIQRDARVTAKLS
jgi:hypothetical protein